MQGWRTGRNLAKPSRGASKRREPSLKSGAGTLDVRLSPEDRSAAPASDAARARRPAKPHSAKPIPIKPASTKANAPKVRIEPKVDLPVAPRLRTPHTKAASGRSGKRRRFGFGRLIYWGAVLAIWAVLAVAGLFTWVGLHLPPIQSLEIPKRPPSIQINSLDARLFATRGEMGGAALPLKDMPAHLPNAFIAIEDRRFRFHHGIDPVGLFRAVVANLLHRGISQGGSTITQQLAKNLFLTQDRNLMRKLQEVVLAMWLEHKFSKNEILELYLNRVYFGSGAYGVEAAAQRYFGKSARTVSVAEAALLAGLVKSPSRLAPTRNYDGAERRAQIVLAAMADARLIKEEAAKAAMAAPPKIVKPSAGGSSNYVADWVMDVLNELVGRVEEDIVVDTTIDGSLQAVAEKAVIEEIAQKGEKFGVEQGALVAMTPDGAVRALVGGRSYVENQFNRAVAAKRQPGSAFKPFVYLTALEHGLTPDTIRDDRPIELKNWRPENYGHEYFGPVTLTQALAQSLNTVSVRLTLEFGPTAVVRTAHRLGIASKLEPNASIALGTSEVSVLELVSAYAPFANGGNAVMPHVVERVRTAHGKTLYARNAPSPRPRRRSPLCRDDERDDAGDADLRHRAQGGPAGLDRRRQDRHQPGFPRRLVRRLHQQARHRRVVRQRRFFADQEGDRRRLAGRSLEPVHEGGAPGNAGDGPSGHERGAGEPGRGGIGGTRADAAPMPAASPDAAASRSGRPRGPSTAG